jgi:hypothetical protein
MRQAMILVSHGVLLHLPGAFGCFGVNKINLSTTQIVSYFVTRIKKTLINNMPIRV